MQKIYFRADGGRDIGYGHFIRSLALADMLRNDFACTFFTRDPSAYQIREARDICPLVSLPADESRFERFLEILQGDEIVVLDNYFYSTEYQRRIREKGCKLVCIDDIHDRHFEADIIINHGFASENDYDARPDTRFCLGPRWALLRAPFRRAAGCLTRDCAARAANQAEDENLSRTQRAGKGLRLAICFGGSDPLGLAFELGRRLQDIPAVARLTIVTAADRPKDGFNDKVTVAQSLDAAEMADLFTHSDIAVVSMSSVSYEALCSGAVLMAGWYVDNQRNWYAAFLQRGLIAPLGNLADHIPDRESLESLLENLPAPAPALFAGGSDKRFKALFRGLQCRREFQSELFRLKPYTELDKAQQLEVLRCRNDERVRKWMSSTDVIPQEQHMAYIERLKTDDSAFYWAAYDAKGQYCGSISLTRVEDGRGDFGIFLNPDQIGSGLGVHLSACSYALYFRTLGFRSIYSVVQQDNHNAIRMYRRQGFSIGESRNGFLPIELTKENWETVCSSSQNCPPTTATT